jgi:hypothetical protein
VDNATFDVSNAIGFENSYFVSGAANGPGKTSIMVTGGGKFHVRDTDGNGQAFAVFSNGYRCDTNIVIGGANAHDAKSTMEIDGLMFIAPPVGETTESQVTLSQITVDSSGQLLVRDATVFACDSNYAATLQVSAGGLADLGQRTLFSGGSPDPETSNGAGSTEIVNRGEIRAGSFEYLADSRTTIGNAGVTNISLITATSRMIADGVDDPGTPDIDSGFFAPSRGNGSVGSDLAIGGQVMISVEGTIEVNEAFFAGDMQFGNFTLALQGAGAIVDAGGLFAVNDRGLSGSDASVTVASGAMLMATSFSSGAPGSIRINAVPGSGAATVTISAGGTLASGDSIEIGGRLDESGSGVFTRITGTPAVVSSDGMIRADGLLFLAAESTLRSRQLDVEGAYIEGDWNLRPVANAERIRTGNLHVWPAGTVRFDAAFSPASPSLMVTANISIENGATFDLSNNAILVHPDIAASAPTTLAILKQLLANGRTGDGAGGISSSTITGSTALGYVLKSTAGTFLGEPYLPGDLLVRFTLEGDADLSGSVDFDDLLILARNYSETGEWFTGDFNFDGTVSFDDLLSLAQYYGSTLLEFGSTSPDAFVADWQLAQSLVPEPIAGAALLLSFTRTRRRD